MLVLSLFPGIGLLDMAFEQEGFCVVRGPDLLWGGDIKLFHPPAGKFDGIIGGPPCQLFSRLYKLVEHNRKKHPERYKRQAENLIPEFERCICEAGPRWYLMENVPAAPTPAVPNYRTVDRLVNNRWCGGAQNRVRRFTFGSAISSAIVKRFNVPGVALESADYTPAVTASGTTWVPVRISGSYGDKSTKYLNHAIKAQGLPDGFLDHAPFTVRGKIKAVGNGVPLPLGRAVARSVKHALGMEET